MKITETNRKKPYTQELKRVSAFSKLDTGKIESVAGSEIIDWEEGLRELLSQL